MGLAGKLYRKFQRFFLRVKSTRIGLHKEYFYSKTLDGPIPVQNCKIDVSAVLLEKGQEELLLRIWPVNIEKIKKRLESNTHLAYVIFHRGEPVAYQWVQYGGKHFIQQAGEYMDLKTGRDFMIFHARVADKYQGKGINKFMKSLLIHDFQKKGYSRAFIYTSSKNLPNQKGIEKLGFSLRLKIKSVFLNDNFLKLSSQKIGDRRI